MNTASYPPVFTLHRGTLPLLVSIPHAGTRIPDEIAETMTPVARHVDDCDWHLERLYDFAKTLGASVIVPLHARYVVDLNRPPDDANLYPGQDTTGLVPVDTFDKSPLYAEGDEPTVTEIARRRERYWRPYHDALAGELERLKGAHGRVLLWEAHSIRSQVPRFFEGRLPDFNFGTSNGASAAPGLADKLAALVDKHGGYTSIANGRFKGGYITRHYGAPEHGVQAVQLELVQATYMDETRPYSYDEAKARRIVPLLEALARAALEHR
ncbi:MULTISPECIES: N-formylglutamate deformylase [Burkholderia]|uniref:N-formylglutamate deformylase n=1 Tax=Burkholderia savannae TaxID=1637837 RepID=A0ABR5TC49_9BURK|nr:MULTISPECIES: N-formylglutamate deformylase [Burkholderia]AOJ68287.1 N-formylglutamate deformylase [Burkholderia savannae]AOJ80361.1 N-formylglutamate deformylase [Burkholderia savannae]AOK46584.1 N-formylglutamate deformylase [Burkholderia sp. MSMB617WGS]KGR98430.1 N-formylglutamate deformylase [Burkholderia sp. ABCPW 111]KVG43143.1 N-formylglutamate deformylase [Burkholderia sp. MSMB0265]